MAASEGPSAWEALRGNVLAVGVVSLLTDLSSEMINPLLPVFVAGLAPGSAAVLLGAIEGLAEATASLLKLFSGRLSDRLGRRKPLVLLGYSLSTFARPALALAAVGWHAVALKFADRVGKGIRTSPRDALIGDAVPAERRALAFSFHRAMDHTGAVLGPLLALLVLYLTLGEALWLGETGTASSAEMAALRTVFAWALAPGLLALAVLALAVRETGPAAAAKTEGAAAALPRRFYWFVGASGVFALGNSSDLFLLLYARERFGAGLLGLLGLWVALHAVKVAASVPGGLLADRLGKRRAILAGWAVYAGVYLGLARATAAWQIWALLLVYGIYYGLTEGAAKALVVDYAGPGRRATALGIYHAAVGLAALPASLLFGVYWSVLGPAVAFTIGAGLAATAALLLLATGAPPKLGTR